MRTAFLRSLVSVGPLLPPRPTCREPQAARLLSSPPRDWLEEEEEEETSLTQSLGVGEDRGVIGKPNDQCEAGRPSLPGLWGEHGAGVEFTASRQARTCFIPRKVWAPMKGSTGF